MLRSSARRALGTATALLLMIPAASEARLGFEPFSANGLGAPLEDVEVFAVEERNRSELILEADRRQQEKHGRHEFAAPVDVRLDASTKGTWETLADGARLWRLVIDAPGATDLNLGLSRFRLPAGATLHVIAPDHDYYQGPYTSNDNKPHGELWLPVTPGDRAVVEMYVPAYAEFEPELELQRISYGFRDWFKLEEDQLGRQGSCNIDVICPIGDPWNDEEQSVGVYTVNGIWTCTGSMVMNTAADYTPYFLTAYHCGVTASNDQAMVVYWNYESPVCGQLAGGSLSDNQSGAIFRSRRQDVDQCLVELEEEPDPESNVYYAGWDAGGSAPAGCVGIHHPSTDEKAISFNYDTLTTQNSCIGGGGSSTHWRISNWEEDSTTEPGSSGSGIWDINSKRLVGFLSGGLAACGNTQYDCYGKFSVAWNGTGASTRLRDWLDPISSGALAMDGSFSDGVGRLSYIASGGVDECATNPAQENSIWEPGEKIEIPVTILASGAHTGISGVLSTSTPGVTILDDTASFPDLTGASGGSISPHFTILIDEAFVCDSAIDFDLTLASAEGGPWVESFSQMVGSEPVPASLPLAIPDNVPAGASSDLFVGSGAVITDVDVFVEITHSRVGDLVIKLEGPLGDTVTLLDRPGYPFNANGCEDNNMIVTFDDEFFAPIETHCGGATPWYDGPAKPVQPLSVFDGQSTAGTWKLIVEDRNGGDTGTVTNWQLQTTPPLPQLCDVCPTSTDVTPAAVATGFGLAAPRPNPFAASTALSFTLARPAATTLDVFDVSGRLVRSLVDTQLSAGTHTTTWDGRDRSGQIAAAGIYFVKLKSGTEEDLKRVNLVR